MLGRQTCVGCGRVSPETNGDNTLTTSFGWRVRRGMDATGGGVVEWRCANCWQRWKAQQSSPTSDSPGTSSVPVGSGASVAPGSVPPPPIRTPRPPRDGR